MNFFGRSEITVRCTFRGNSLAVPHAERLLDSCRDEHRRRLRRELASLSVDDQLWSVNWHKKAGEALRPQDLVGVLRLKDMFVELVYVRNGVLLETNVAEGERARVGSKLAEIRKPVAPAPPPDREKARTDFLLKLMLRHRRDVEGLEKAALDLSEHRQLVDQLRLEIRSLRAQQASAEPAGSDDRKFKRLKIEFSRHFHPDGCPLGETERQRRQRVFQEFWPIVEEIERS
jgi:hypothetical protein